MVAKKIEAAKQLLEYFDNEEKIKKASASTAYLYAGNNSQIRKDLLDWAVESALEGPEAAKAARNFLEILETERQIAAGGSMTYLAIKKKGDLQAEVTDWANDVLDKSIGTCGGEEEWAQRCAAENESKSRGCSR